MRYSLISKNSCGTGILARLSVLHKNEICCKLILTQFSQDLSWCVTQDTLITTLTISQSVTAPYTTQRTLICQRCQIMRQKQTLNNNKKIITPKKMDVTGFEPVTSTMST